MNLTGKELVAKGIVTGKIEIDNIQQHGVDLNLVTVERIHGPGIIPIVGKTKLAQRTLALPIETDIDGRIVFAWHLKPGAYDVTFEQGCEVPADQRLEIFQRSSVLRNGGILRSSVFDAGFKTRKIGTVITFHEPIIIEVGARVAQIVAVASNTVENLYDGQWQNDKQRTAVNS